MRENLDMGRPDHVQLIFDGRVNGRIPSRYRVTADALFGALDRLDPRARAVYAWTEVSVDLIFPVAYGLLLALALLPLFGDGRPFYLLPIAGAVADVFENISIALLAATYDGALSSWTRVAAVFTLLKSVLLLAAMIAAVGGMIRWLWGARRSA